MGESTETTDHRPPFTSFFLSSRPYRTLIKGGQSVAVKLGLAYGGGRNGGNSAMNEYHHGYHPSHGYAPQPYEPPTHGHVGTGNNLLEAALGGRPGPAVTPGSTNHHNPSNASTYKMSRNVSNSHPALERSDVHVEYEVAVPIHSIESIRHTPYHSLWNLHEW
uniref:Uncharacterized protein n=1 Tax=Anopheles maculatus TaxID=74869 RepID=A0A182SNF1_9DIPT